MHAKESSQGLVLEAKVKPDSGRFSLSFQKGTAVIETCSKPEAGKANLEILTELGKLFSCRVSMLKGRRSSRKTLLFAKLSLKEFLKRLNRNP